MSPTSYQTAPPRLSIIATTVGIVKQDFALELWAEVFCLDLGRSRDPARNWLAAVGELKSQLHALHGIETERTPVDTAVSLPGCEKAEQALAG